MCSIPDPIQREGAMDGHHVVYLPCVLSGKGTLTLTL